MGDMLLWKHIYSNICGFSFGLARFLDFTSDLLWTERLTRTSSV